MLDVALLLRLLRRPTVAAVLVLGLLVSVSDWPSGVLRGFWVDHAVTSAVVTGLVFLAFGVSVVDGFARERAEEHRARVGQITLDALASQAALVRDGLRLVLTGRELAPDGVEEPSARGAQVRFWLDALGEPHPVVGDRGDRVRLLAAQPGWPQLALEVVVELRRGGRDVVATWAPTLLDDVRTARWLRLVADLHDELRRVQEPIQDLRDAREAELRELGGVDELARRWCDLVVRCLVVEEDLRRETGRDDWPPRARDQLTPAEVGAVEAEHAGAKRHRRWRPARAPGPS